MVTACLSNSPLDEKFFLVTVFSLKGLIGVSRLVTVLIHVTSVPLQMELSPPKISTELDAQTFSKSSSSTSHAKTHTMEMKTNSVFHSSPWF